MTIAHHEAVGQSQQSCPGIREGIGTYVDSEGVEKLAGNAVEECIEMEAAVKSEMTTGANSQSQLNWTLSLYIICCKWHQLMHKERAEGKKK